MKERMPINQVSNMPRKIINTYFDPTQNTSNNQPMLNNQTRNQTFQTYLKQKATDQKTHKEKFRKQLIQVGAETNNQYSQSKPFQKGIRRILAKSEQKDIGNDNQQKRAYDVPSVDKTKTASNNFRHKINKNVIKDTMTEKARQSTPPNSEQSFRVRLQGGDKKLLEDLSKLNELQRTLQYEIMQLHSQTKKTLSDTLEKYQIKKIQFNSANFGNINYESIDENDSFKNSPKKNRFLNDSIQEKKLDKLNKQIGMINKNLELSKNEIIKREARIQSMPLYNYLNFSPDIFEQRESEDENQQVQQLPKNNPNSDPSKTYQSVMSEMKKKKWSLHQRFNYDDNAKMGESRIADKPINKDTLTSVGVKEGDQETKIVVNERLKNLLLS